MHHPKVDSSYAVLQAFELATGDYLFEPHSGEDYTRDEGTESPLHMQAESTKPSDPLFILCLSSVLFLLLGEMNEYRARPMWDGWCTVLAAVEWCCGAAVPNSAVLSSWVRSYSPHYRAAGRHTPTLCPLWEVLTGILQP